MLLNFKADAEQVTTDTITQELLRTVERPKTRVR